MQTFNAGQIRPPANDSWVAMPWGSIPKRDVARQKNLLELSKIVIMCQILRCRPSPMNKAMAAHCNDLGYTKAIQFQFWFYHEAVVIPNDHFAKSLPR